MISILSRAAVASSSLPEDITKARLFERTARILWNQNKKAEATEFFECALAIAAKLTYGDPAQTKDFTASIDILWGRARAGDISGALLHVKDFADIGLQDRVVADVARAAGELGKFDLAEKTLAIHFGERTEGLRAVRPHESGG